MHTLVITLIICHNIYEFWWVLGKYQSGSLLHKDAVDSYFKLISKFESSRN